MISHPSYMGDFSLRNPQFPQFRLHQLPRHGWNEDAIAAHVPRQAVPQGLAMGFSVKNPGEPIHSTRND